MIDRLLWFSSAILATLVLTRLFRERLHRSAPYGAFFLMLSIMLGRDIALFFIPVQTLKYTEVWEITLPLVFVTQAWAGISCYQAIAALYPKIGRFAVKLFAAALAVSIVATLAGLLWEVPNLHNGHILRSLILCYRWINTLLAGGILLAVAFLSRFPAPLKRMPQNILRHTTLLSLYFCLYAVSYFLPIARIPIIDTVRMALVCMLYATWAVALSSKGQASAPWPQIDAETKAFLDQRDATARAFFVGS